MHTGFGSSPFGSMGNHTGEADADTLDSEEINRLLSDPSGKIDGRVLADVLEALAIRMNARSLSYWQHYCGPTAYEDNDNIPAGYTYLAQLVAHDLVANVAPVPRLEKPTEFAHRDNRAQRLILDTLYGGGPLSTPAPYHVAKVEGGKAILFRLGRVGMNETERRNLRSHEDGILEDGPARDIPRTSCPFLNDNPRRGFTDTMLTDPRNDDNLLVSQLTTIFLELHNHMAAVSVPSRRHPSSENEEHALYRHFVVVRKAVAAVYRRIVVNDLLSRLLDKEIYDRYRNAGTDIPDPHVCPDHQGTVLSPYRMPPEFPHAVFRSLHAMVRGRYDLNDDLRKEIFVTIRDVLDRTSSRRPNLVPLSRNWLVDWRFFFELEDGFKPNLSRRLLPDVGHGTLATDSHFPSPGKNRKGGLYFIDLLRGAGSKVEPVRDLIARLPSGDLHRSELLHNENDRKTKILKWLKETSAGVTSDAMAGFIAENPPLYFFTLFEAAHDKCGSRLGILGSTITAEVIFGAYASTHSVIEEDARIQDILDSTFGSDVPDTMPKLIRFLQSNGQLGFPVP